MNDHRMLRMSGEERGLEIEGIWRMGMREKWVHSSYAPLQERGINSAFLLLLNHDCPSHLRVNRAKIAISAGSAGCDCELLIRIECSRFLKLLLDADNGVRFFVPINPGHLLSRLHRYGLGIKGEVFDLDSVLFGAVGVLHLATERDERQIEKSDAAQERRHFIFGNKGNHSLSRSS